MRQILVCCIATLVISGTIVHAEGLVVPGATEEGVLNDCQVTAELSVMLLKMKAKNPPDQLMSAAATLLADKGYKGSFGDAGFIARFYTGLALQMGAEVDPAMAAATPAELEDMKAEHEASCLEKALKELNAKPNAPLERKGAGGN